MWSTKQSHSDDCPACEVTVLILTKAIIAVVRPKVAFGSNASVCRCVDPLSRHPMNRHRQTGPTGPFRADCVEKGGCCDAEITVIQSV